MYAGLKDAEVTYQEHRSTRDTVPGQAGQALLCLKVDPFGS